MWMVRAGEAAYLIEDFKSQAYVAIGWSKLGNISLLKSRDEVKDLLKQRYSYNKIKQLNIETSMVSRFLLEFKKGDYVISYDNLNRNYLIGQLDSDYIFDKSKKDYFQTRKVKWLGEVPRDKLSTATRNTLGAIATIFHINSNAAAEIIRVLEGKQESSEEEEEEETEEETLKEDMESKAHELIKDHVMALDWEEMQQVVAGILVAMGFKATISEAGPDRGKDIEASPDGLMLKDPRILVEVKHRSGAMGAKDIRNFNSVLRGGQKGLYVSTGGFSKDAKYEAERGIEQITLIDADRLVDLIVQNYDAFSTETKLLIPLTKIFWPSK
ncbi:MAG: restriction endonuclease [Candidatus Bathyarchaeia archaeon]